MPAATPALRAANRVTFDAGKEDTTIISTTEPFGGPVKFLGIEFDGRLVMNCAAHKCVAKAAWKMRFLLDVRRDFFVAIC